MIAQTKSCRVCGEYKPLSCYTPDKRARDGVQARCKACCTAIQAADRKANPEKHRSADRLRYSLNKDLASANAKKYRTKHKAELVIKKKGYYDRIKKTDAYVSKQAAYIESTKPRKKEYDKVYAQLHSKKKCTAAKEWQARNPESRRATTFAYDSRRRAQKSGGATGREVKVWAAAQEKVCKWCGVECADEYHIDHVIPLSKGGAHETHNFAIACQPCNSKKSSRMPDEFLKLVGRITVSPDMVRGMR